MSTFFALLDNPRNALYLCTIPYCFRNEISPESDTYTIEHIFPESADETWGDFTSEETNRSIYRLGNLTLL